MNIKNTLPAGQSSCSASFKGLVNVHISTACLCGGVVMDKVMLKLPSRISRTEYKPAQMETEPV